MVKPKGMVTKVDIKDKLICLKVELFAPVKIKYYVNYRNSYIRFYTMCMIFKSAIYVMFMQGLFLDSYTDLTSDYWLLTFFSDFY